MQQDDSLLMMREMMMEFAGLTGLTSEGDGPRRYLWTDAFAVCNFLTLYRRTGESAYLDLALRLVQQVHYVLGRHRDDDPRHGWISGLNEEEGKIHPTGAGLRIGKSMTERAAGEIPDDLEWDRDGQYFHYLTKWMHALNGVSRVTGEAMYLLWAIELAQAAHARFLYRPFPGGRKRMYWKMSIDLARPLVPSMGQHDPLDGMVSFLELQATTRGFPQTSFPDLSEEIADLAEMCRGEDWITDDPLGIGGLLFDAWRMAQLISKGDIQATFVEAALDAAVIGLQSFEKNNPLKYQARYRLPFREFGLSIGLKATGELREWLDARLLANLQRPVERVMQYIPLGELIERFWRDRKNREAESWCEHRGINMVMLATSLAPEEFLTV